MKETNTGKWIRIGIYGAIAVATIFLLVTFYSYLNETVFWVAIGVIAYLIGKALLDNFLIEIQSQFVQRSGRYYEFFSDKKKLEDTRNRAILLFILVWIIVFSKINATIALVAGVLVLALLLSFMPKIKREIQRAENMRLLGAEKKSK